MQAIWQGSSSPLRRDEARKISPSQEIRLKQWFTKIHSTGLKGRLQSRQRHLEDRTEHHPTWPDGVALVAKVAQRLDGSSLTSLTNLSNASRSFRMNRRQLFNGCRTAMILPPFSQLGRVFGETPRYSAASDIRRYSRSFCTSVLPGEAIPEVLDSTNLTRVRYTDNVTRGEWPVQARCGLQSQSRPDCRIGFPAESVTLF